MLLPIIPTQKILLFGGTFCPPHLAHTELASVAEAQYQFDNVIFIPCQSPVLDKRAHASIKDRVAMLALAIEPFKNFTMDLCEIYRSTPSYMVTTLAYFRQRHGPLASLTLMIGMDNFLQLPRWHQWQNILSDCHLLVVDRPNFKPIFEPTLKKLLHDHPCTPAHNLNNSPHGTITLMDAGQYDVSSTQIRSVIRQKILLGSNTDDMICREVRDYIEEHHLF